MIEIFTSLGMSELGAYILSLGSPIATIIAMVVVACVCIYKMSKAIAEFRNTDEMKQLTATIKEQNAKIRVLEKMERRLVKALEKKIDLGELDDGKD